jgi:hypothetical protein
MHQEKLGFYVLKISENEPKSGVFMIKLPNRLNFGDVNITFINDPEKHYQEVVISYKTAYINTYNILVLEADTLGNDQYIIYRHESFQLWESKIQGTILQNNFNFVIVNKDGMSALSLGNVQKQKFTDDQGNIQLLHSLESQNYLKCEQDNHLVFECSKADKMEISVLEEYQKGSQKSEEKDIEETRFQAVYKIKLWKITLRDLMLIMSIYSTKTFSHVY